MRDFCNVVLHHFNRKALMNPDVRVIVVSSVEAIAFVANKIAWGCDVVMRSAEGDVSANTFIGYNLRPAVLCRSECSALGALYDRARVLALMGATVFQLADGDGAIRCRVLKYMTWNYDIRERTRWLPPPLPVLSFRANPMCISNSITKAHNLEGRECLMCTNGTFVYKEVYERKFKEVEEMWMKAVSL
jgi:hypothetical protein